MDFLILRFTLPFLSISEITEMWVHNIIKAGDVSFYISEKFNLLPDINFQIVEQPFKVVKTENEATWDRIYNDDTLKDRILNNPFINDNPRLKTRIYLAVKRNEPKLLKYYYDNYSLVKSNNTKKLFIGPNASTLLYEMAPMSLDGREMKIIDHVLTIKNPHNITIGIICMDGNVELIENDETRDLEFLLPIPESMTCIYNSIHPSKRPRQWGKHRRPKIKKRKLLNNNEIYNTD